MTVTCYFQSMLAQCGLSIAEAAVFLEQSEQDIQAWVDGKEKVPKKIRQLLALLYDQIYKLANDTAETMLEDITSYEEVDIAKDYYGFSDLPCKGARDACVALTIMLSTIYPDSIDI